MTESIAPECPFPICQYSHPRHRLECPFNTLRSARGWA
jgi:hypothetical protein